MNIIFFGQNIPIADDVKHIIIKYINHTKYRITVSGSYIVNSSPTSITANLSAAQEIGPSINIKNIDITEDTTNITIYPLQSANPVGAPSSYFIMAEMKDITNNKNIGTYNRSYIVGSTNTDKSISINVDIDYNSGMYANSDVSITIPEQDETYRLTIYDAQHTESNGIFGNFVYSSDDQVGTYGPIIGTGYNHYLIGTNGVFTVDLYANGIKKGRYAATDEGATTVGIIPSGYDIFIDLVKYEPSGIEPPTFVDLTFYPCVQTNLEQKESIVTVRLNNSGGAILFLQTYASAEDNWVAYESGYRLALPIKLTDLEQNTTIYIEVKEVGASASFTNTFTVTDSTTEYIWLN